MADLSELVLTRQNLAGLRGGINRAFPFLELLTFDVAYWEDDFMGDQMKYDATVPGTYATYGNASGTFTLVTNAVNGQAQVSTVGTTANDYCGAYLPNKPFETDLNPFIAARIYVTTITGCKVEVGFGDATTNAGIVNVLATPSFNATNGVCWAYDTNDTGNDTGFQLVGVDAGTGATKIEPSSPTVIAATWYTLGLQVKSTNAKGYIWDANGGLVCQTAWMTDAIADATQVFPWVFVQTRAAAARTVNVDFLRVWQRRTTS